jgi:hypothetical protein
MTLLALLTPFTLSLLHAGRINCCYRSVRVRLVVTYRIFASLTAAQHERSVLTAFRPVRASTTPAQHSSKLALQEVGRSQPPSCNLTLTLLMAGDHIITIIKRRTDLGPGSAASNFVPSAPAAIPIGESPWFDFVITLVWLVWQGATAKHMGVFQQV